MLNPLLQGVALAVGFMLLDVLGPTGPATFLYFQLLMSDRPATSSRFGRRRRTAASALVAILVAFALGVLLNAPAMKKTGHGAAVRRRSAASGSRSSSPAAA